MERIRQNVKKLKEAYFSFTQVPENLEYMKFEKANDIEKILYEIDKIIGDMENNFIYCGVAGCGQARLWQQRFRRPKTWNSQPYKLSQYADTDTLRLIATESDKNVASSTSILGLSQIGKRDDVYASIQSTNGNMEIIDDLVGDTSDYILRNILQNGALRNTTNWSTQSSTYTTYTTGECVTITGTNNGTTAYPTTQSFDKFFGRSEEYKRVFYACGKTRSRTTNSAYPVIYLSYYENDVPTPLYLHLNSTDGLIETALNDNEWHTLSTTLTTFDSSNYFDYFRIAFGMNALTIDNIVDFKDIAIFDLTEIFGRGNEPSKEWCDANINYVGNDIVISKEVYNGNN